jgi:hypothetical protein
MHAFWRSVLLVPGLWYPTVSCAAAQAKPDVGVRLARAHAALDEGYKLLREGAPRSQVVKHWALFARTRPHYPKVGIADVNRPTAINWDHPQALSGTSDPIGQLDSRLRDTPGPTLTRGEPVFDLLSPMRLLIREEERLKRSRVRQPERLPVDEQVDYHVSRLIDYAGGWVNDRGVNPAANASFDSLVKIGDPAIPALFERLYDERPTRAAYGWTVLRVQDVALRCIEAITNERFRIELYPSASAWTDEQPKYYPYPVLISELHPNRRRAFYDHLKRWKRQRPIPK